MWEGRASEAASVETDVKLDNEEARCCSLNVAVIEAQYGIKIAITRQSGTEVTIAAKRVAGASHYQHVTISDKNY